MVAIFHSARAIVALDVAVSQPGLTVANGPPGLAHREIVRAWLRRRGCGDQFRTVKSEQEAREALAGAEPLMVLDAVDGVALDLADVAEVALGQGTACLLLASEPRPLLLPSSASSLPTNTFVMTAEEIVAELSQFDIPREVATSLAWLTAGWPGLLQHVITGHANPEHLTPSIASPRLQDLLRRRLLPWVPSEWHEAVLYLAVAGSASPAELGKVRGGAGACAGLIDLELVSSRRGQDQDYGIALLPPLQSVLVDEAHTKPAMWERTLEQIADIRYELGAGDCGLQASYDLMDWDRCAAILDRWWQRGLHNGYRDLGADVLRALPASYLRQFPMVGQRAEYMGILPVGSVELRVPDTVAEIEAVLRDGTVTRLMERSLLGIATRTIDGKAREAAAMAKDMARVVQLATRVPNNGTRRLSTFWHVHAALACEAAGDDDAAQQLLAQGWNDRVWDESGSATQDVVAHMALLKAHRGELNEARLWLSRYAELPPVEDWTAPYVERHVRLSESIIAWDGLDPNAPSAGRLLEDVYATDTIWPYAFELAKAAALSSGDPEEIIALADGAEAAHFVAARSDGIAPNVLRAGRAMAHLALGQGSRASRVLGPVADDDQYGVVAQACRMLATDQLEEAAARALRAARRPTFSPRNRRLLHLLAAAALAAGGRPEEALEPMSQALRDAEKEQDRRVTTLIPEPFRGLLAETFPTHATYFELGPSVLGNEVSWVELSEREMVILRELAQGKTLKHIADTQYISRNTVKTQVRSIYLKLEVSSRDAAVQVAERLGLIGHR